MKFKIINYSDRRIIGNFFRENKNIKILSARLLLDKNIYIEYSNVDYKNTILKYDHLSASNMQAISDHLKTVSDNFLASDILLDFKVDQENCLVSYFVFWEESSPYETILPLPDRFPEDCIFESTIGSGEDRGQYVTFSDGKKFIAVEGFGMSLVEKKITHDFKLEDDESFRKKAEGYYLYPR